MDFQKINFDSLSLQKPETTILISVIIGTSRPKSRSAEIANWYVQNLEKRNIDCQLLSLENQNILYRNESMISIEKKFLIPADKFIFIIPEYNGSFPGILKLLLDNSDITKAFWHKKALLTGIADGRGGNLRGLEHFTNIMHYLKVNVHWNKLPISKISTLMDIDSGEVVDSATIKEMNEQLEQFILY